MAPSLCALCKTSRALILRPKNHQKLCKPCFIHVFETEIHHTITSHALFQPGEHIAIGASGGKDSTVLASVLSTLNARHNYGLTLHLLSIDEGIRGYRDDSLETVKQNAAEYNLPLTILGYGALYGWTMDEVVAQVGKKGNCTYCGVFRRQALDRGAAALGVRHVVTGHNADDMAETVLMNLLRGDLPRLARTTSIVTSTPGAGAQTDIKRSKPLKYAYEKEIVLYAHHKNLTYFSTECIYSPEAFRGSARTLIKNLERIRPSAILDVVRSGEDMAKLVPQEFGGGSCGGGCASSSSSTNVPIDDDSGEGGCGSAQGRTSGGEMAAMEEQLASNDGAEANELETEIKLPPVPLSRQSTNSTLARKAKSKAASTGPAPSKYQKQTIGQCAKCGYLSSQPVCKACTLLKGLNKNRPKSGIAVGESEEKDGEMPRVERLRVVAES